MAGDTIRTSHYWEKELMLSLVGATINEVRYMTDREAKEFGWYSKAPMLILGKPNDPDTYYIFPQMDDEGNNAGALAYGCFNPKVHAKVKEELFPVIDVN